MKKTLPVIHLLADFFDTYMPVTIGLSEKTIISYQYAFQLLFDYLHEERYLEPEKVMFRDLEQGTIEKFLAWLESNRNSSVSTRNQRLSAISAFAKYAMRRDVKSTLSFGSEVTSIPKKKVPKDDTIVYLTLEEMTILLKTPNPITKIGRRDLTLLSVLYASGARAQEICDLKINDIHFQEKTSLRLLGKGNKGRIVTIPDECAKLLKNYMEANNLDALKRKEPRHVFSSQTHEHMTVSCVEEIVKKYVKKAISANPLLFPSHNYTPHSFRHSIAVHMLESGVPLPVIKNFLGHASIETTMIYAKVTPELAHKYLRERKSLITILPPPELPQNISDRLPFLRKSSKRL